MTVAIVSLSARGESGIAVCFELSDGEHRQRETFTVDSRAVADLSLKVGICDRELFDKVSYESLVYNAVKRGANILGYGACSEKMLVRKLGSKGIKPEIAKKAAEELVRRGYMNPQADAAREAQKCALKLWGRKRIAAELFHKGYSDENVRSALYSLEDEGVDFDDLCAERIRNSVDEIPTDPAKRQKLIASLQRYGFSSSEIKEGLKKAFE